MAAVRSIAARPAPCWVISLIAWCSPLFHGFQHSGAGLADAPAPGRYFFQEFPRRIPSQMADSLDSENLQLIPTARGEQISFPHQPEQGVERPPVADTAD